MAVWEFPREVLEAYAGTNARPDDFDEYWSEVIEELDRQDPQVRVETADLGYSSADCMDLWFKGIGGADVHAKLLRPRAQATSGQALALFHGYTARSPDWIDLLPFAAEGFTVAAMDCRGQGGESIDVGGSMRHTVNGHIVRGLTEGPRSLLYRSVFADAAQVARILADMPGVDADRIGAVGRSQGGGLAIACAALEPSVRGVAATFPFLADYRRVWDLDLAKDAYAEITEWLRRFDPRHERVDEMFSTLGYIDVQHLAPRIAGTTLMVTAMMDTVVPPSTQFAVFNKIRADKRMITYPDFGHEELPEERDIVLRFLRETL